MPVMNGVVMINGVLNKDEGSSSLEENSLRLKVTVLIKISILLS